jgi:hypothetical protein
MEFIEFDGVNIRIAENQPEYQTLPAQLGLLPIIDAHGRECEGVAMTCCAKLDEAELEQVRTTGCVYLTILTFGQNLQPIHSTFLPPNMTPIPTE